MTASGQVIRLSAGDRTRLGTLAERAPRADRLALRARIVLALAGGAPVRRVAREVGVSEPTVRLWRSRFAAGGVAGLRDAPRMGRPGRAEAATRAIVTALSRTPPRPGRWSLRALSRETGLPVTTVHRICHERAVGWPAAGGRAGPVP